MKADQKRHLRGKISSLAREKNSQIEQSIKEPPEVAKARKLARDWDDRKWREKQRIHSKVDVLIEKARHELLFGDAESALKAVAAIEAFKPKPRRITKKPAS